MQQPGSLSRASSCEIVHYSLPASSLHFTRVLEEREPEVASEQEARVATYLAV